jgi:hypothetical protein
MLGLAEFGERSDSLVRRDRVVRRFIAILLWQGNFIRFHVCLELTIMVAAPVSRASHRVEILFSAADGEVPPGNPHVVVWQTIKAQPRGMKANRSDQPRETWPACL